eukprot:1453509-Amphidinium_carterae.1
MLRSLLFLGMRLLLWEVLAPAVQHQGGLVAAHASDPAQHQIETQSIRRIAVEDSAASLPKPQLTDGRAGLLSPRPCVVRMLWDLFSASRAKVDYVKLSDLRAESHAAVITETISQNAHHALTSVFIIDFGAVPAFDLYASSCFCLRYPTHGQLVYSYRHSGILPRP